MSADEPARFPVCHASQGALGEVDRKPTTSVGAPDIVCRASQEPAIQLLGPLVHAVRPRHREAVRICCAKHQHQRRRLKLRNL
ncbi:MAG: hypothetical protein BJ554DRAFT_1752 [Olpidium bornovanus]|uniref:Uncharacterized protein n=1 Tax=Olpidium bornovanus TaxID=278681 RepID=A0A8H7ZR49_9FUNG|nr:MAG: hypothetical protein BJ554DRAFT_1752 [Olpidium bornovanus]